MAYEGRSVIKWREVEEDKKGVTSDVVHGPWDCPEWDQARETWRPWLRDAATAIPQLGPPDQWPACLWRAGLFPLRLAQGLDQGLLDEFLYRLHGMHLAARGGRLGRVLVCDPPPPSPPPLRVFKDSGAGSAPNKCP